MNVSAQGHASAQYDAKVAQSARHNRPEEAAVGQGLSRRVSAQPPTSRQLADYEADVGSRVAESRNNLLDRVCDKLAPHLVAGLGGLALGAVVGGVAGLFAGALPGMLLIAPLGAAAFAIMMPGGLIGCFGGIAAGAAIGCATHLALKKPIRAVKDKVSSVWTHYAKPDIQADQKQKGRSLVSRACHKIIPYVDTGMAGTVCGAGIGTTIGGLLGAFPGVVVLSPIVAVAGGVVGAGCGALVGGTIGCIFHHDQERQAREEQEQWDKERPARLRRQQELLQELRAEHARRWGERAPEQARKKTASSSVAEKKAKAWAARRDTGVRRMQESAQDWHTASAKAL